MAKSKYEQWEENGELENKLILIQGWAREGVRDEDIAKNLGITRKTLWQWKSKYEELKKAMSVAKEEADYIVENALFKNATGFYYTEQTVVMQKTVEYNDDGKRQKETTKPVTVEVTKFKPAETTAQIFWLKNRKPSKWKDKQEIGMDEEKPFTVQIKVV